MEHERTPAKRLLLGAISLVLLVGCGSDEPSSVDTLVELDANDVHVANAYAVAPTDDETTSSVSALLYSSAGDRLVFVDVEDDVAERAVLVGPSADAAEAPLDVVDIPAGADVQLAASTAHIVLEDVAPGFADRSSFELTFNFESSSPRTVIVEVVDET